MKPEKNKLILDILLIISIVLMVSGLLSIPYNLGKVVGMKEYQEMESKFECELNYGSKPQSEITGECLKYFKLQKGN